MENTTTTVNNNVSVNEVAKHVNLIKSFAQQGFLPSIRVGRGSVTQPSFQGKHVAEAYLQTGNMIPSDEVLQEVVLYLNDTDNARLRASQFESFVKQMSKERARVNRLLARNPEVLKLLEGEGQ